MPSPHSAGCALGLAGGIRLRSTFKMPLFPFCPSSCAPALLSPHGSVYTQGLGFTSSVLSVLDPVMARPLNQCCRLQHQRLPGSPLPPKSALSAPGENAKDQNFTELIFKGTPTITPPFFQSAPAQSAALITLLYFSTDPHSSHSILILVGGACTLFPQEEPET